MIVRERFWKPLILLAALCSAPCAARERNMQRPRSENEGARTSGRDEDLFACLNPGDRRACRETGWELCLGPRPEEEAMAFCLEKQGYVAARRKKGGCQGRKPDCPRGAPAECSAGSWECPRAAVETCADAIPACPPPSYPSCRGGRWDCLKDERPPAAGGSKCGGLKPKCPASKELVCRTEGWVCESKETSRPEPEPDRDQGRAKGSRPARAPRP